MCPDRSQFVSNYRIDWHCNSVHGHSTEVALRRPCQPASQPPGFPRWRAERGGDGGVGQPAGYGGGKSSGGGGEMGKAVV